jgi:hypothetical protein
MAVMRVEIFVGKNKQYYVRLRASNGQPRMTSESYKTIYPAERLAKELQDRHRFNVVRYIAPAKPSKRGAEYRPVAVVVQSRKKSPAK